MIIVTKHYDEMVNKITELNNKLTKHGYDTIAIHELKTEVLNNELVYTIEGSQPTTIRLGSFELVAKLTHGEQFIIHTHTDLPTDFFHKYTQPHCEHCKTNHKRIKTFIVYDNNTQEYTQLGSACVSIYLGYDCEQALRMSEAYYDFIDEMGTLDQTKTTGKTAYDLPYILTLSKYATDKYGYTKKGSEDKSTYDYVMDYMTMDNFVVPEYDMTDTITYFQNIDTSNSTYAHNCNQLALTGYVTQNNLGIAISMYAVYKRATQDKVTYRSNYVGTVGQSASFNLTVDKVLYTIEPYTYNAPSRRCYQLHDTAGNIFVWTTDKYFDNGEVLTGKAKVKEHKLYNGVQQTVITNYRIKSV